MTKWLSLMGLGLTAFLLNWLSLFPLPPWLLRWNVVDAPGKRSLHQNPTLRSGELSIVAVFYLTILAAHFALGMDGQGFWGLVITALTIALLGFADDLTNLPRRVRFATWIIIAAIATLLDIRLTHIVLAVVGRIDFGWLAYTLTFVWLIGDTNFYNFMDGIDGLAGSRMAPAILRLGTIYGEGDPGNRARLTQRIGRERFIWVGDASNRKSLIRRKDAPRACVTAACQRGRMCLRLPAP